jgi:hypothetical protein
MVILNRLTEETSFAINLSVPNFGYLFRLHLSLQPAERDPSKEYDRINKDVSERSSSHFVNIFVSFIGERNFDFSHIVDEGARLTRTEPDSLANLPYWVSRVPARDYLFNYVVQNLVLHPDNDIIDFERRVAIACNFLDGSAYTPDFWPALWSLYRHTINRTRKTAVSSYLQALLQIITFSKHILPFASYCEMQKFCCEAALVALRRNRWSVHPEIVAQCVAALGILGAEPLVKLIIPLITELAPSALAKVQNEESKKQVASARLIISALSWALAAYSKRKGTSIFRALRDLPFDPDHLKNPEVAFSLIDLLEPMLSEEDDLRNLLSVGNRRDAEALLRILPPSEMTLAKKYLAEAPGYSCTLFSVLAATGADTILLYAKGYGDSQFFLRDAAGRGRLHPIENLSPNAVEESYLPPWIQDRMKDNLFFYSDETSILQGLDYFTEYNEHRWAIGGAVRTHVYGLRHYCILGFSRSRPTVERRNTAFFYWLRLESTLRYVLPEIHRKYADSLASWNSLVQSIRPYHIGKSDNSEKRRKLIKLALMRFDFADIVQSTVRQSSGAPLAPSDLLDLVDKIIKQFIIFLEESYSLEAEGSHSNNPVAIEGIFPGLRGGKAIRLAAECVVTSTQARHLSISRELVTLIVIEAFCNALSYYKDAIEWWIFIEDGPEPGSCLVAIGVRNDIDQGRVADSGKRTGRGVSCCDTAVRAAGGKFSSAPIASGFWELVAKLPAFVLPSDLEVELYDFIRR